MPRLDPKQIDAFRRDGFVTGVPVLSPAAVSAFVTRMRAFERSRPGDVGWAFDIKANLLFDWVYRVGAEPAILDAVGAVLGENLYLTDSVFRVKAPGSAAAYGWHQDGARIQVEPPFVIVYIAFSKATEENGCLRVVPGSHDRIHPFDLVENLEGQARRRVARVREVDESRAVSLCLNPGEAAIFDGNVIHGSGPNRSRAPRVALLNDYTAAHARQSVGRGSGQLVRGIDVHGNIAPEPVPIGDCTPESVRARRRILNAFPENVLMGPLEPGAAPSFPDAVPRASPGLGAGG